MSTKNVDRLLERARALRTPCDVDLLVFFARHPRSLVTSEQLGHWLGYDTKQIADSLELLLGTGILQRSLSPAHAARMYVLVVEGETGGWLPALLDLLSTRDGRLTVLRALAHTAPAPGNPGAERSDDRTTVARASPFAIRRSAHG